MKRIYVVLLVVCLLFSGVFSAYADEEPPVGFIVWLREHVSYNLIEKSITRLAMWWKSKCPAAW